MERRLSAILAADVVGYTALMAADEAGTLSSLKALRQDIFDPEIASRGGRIVKLMGDGALVEFPSVVDAVEAALAIQKNLQAEEAPPLRLRMGINLGDVIVEGDDIYGDGVNVAARLEALAPAGGICVSAIVHESIGAKIATRFQDIGLKDVKNLERPLHVFCWPADGLAPSVKPASAPALPDKPSIAVLPFDNMSRDPDQDFFAEGISEDIITELSKFRWLFVVARNSSFSFKGQALDIREVGRRLGVRYLVEGSVRQAGKRVRITAQLIDAIEDTHLWADRYDRDLEDIFAVQDEVTLAIVTTIEPQLAASERQRARRRPPENLDAWACYQRGLWHCYRYTREELDRGIGYLRQANDLDPTFALAYSGLAYALYSRALFGFSVDREADIEGAFQAGRSAVALDENDPFAHAALGRVHIIRSDHEAAIDAADRAISIAPSYAMAHQARAHALWHAGRPAEAIESHDMAIRLSPHDPLLWIFLASKAIALVMLERFEEGIDCSRQAQRQDNHAIFAYVGEISALGLLGRREAAAEAIDRARRVKPDLSLSFVRTSLPVTDPACGALFYGGLERAGLAD